MSLIRRFFYRAPRISSEMPMDLILGDAVVLGVCLDISESGLRGTFAHAVPVGTEGLLTLYQADRTFQVQAAIDSLRDNEVQARFRFGSKKERMIIRDLLTLLTPASSRGR